MSSAHLHGVKKLLFLASSCVYPRLNAQPMRVASLMTGPLESTSEAYAIAKIAGIKLCAAYYDQHASRFISAILADPFGPDCDFDLENCHVIPALIRRMHEAREQCLDEVEVWGSGNPSREFVFSDDLADACIFVMKQYEAREPINVGIGSGVSIRDVAEMIRSVVGYAGRLKFDTSKPDGTPEKILDSSQLQSMGWRVNTDLQSTLQSTYDGFLKLTRCGRGANGQARVQNI
jgi:GDP-L-fucose synthase